MYMLGSCLWIYLSLDLLIMHVHREFNLKLRAGLFRLKGPPDSGATISATSNLELFVSIEKHSPGKRAQVANKSLVDIALIGTIRLNLLDDLRLSKR